MEDKRMADLAKAVRIHAALGFKNKEKVERLQEAFSDALYDHENINECVEDNMSSSSCYDSEARIHYKYYRYGCGKDSMSSSTCHDSGIIFTFPTNFYCGQSNSDGK